MTITAAMLLGLAWKSAAIAGLTLGLLRLARSRSAAERSWIAHAGLAALLVLPIATMMLPQWAPLPAQWFAAAPLVTALPTVETPVPAAAGATTEAAVAIPSLWSSAGDLAPFLYAFPLALLLGIMLIAVLRLFAMRGRAEVLIQPSWLTALAEAQRRMGFKHGTALLVSDELRSPISWGVIRPTIVLNPTAVDAVREAEAIIAHELAHVARLDWAKLLAARAACALYWFNPLVWLLARESHQLREEAADDAVLMADIDAPDYASLLVGAARHDNQAVLLAAHGVAPARSSLRRRITRVLDASLQRGPASSRWAIIGLLLLAGVTAPLAAFSASADPAAGRTDAQPALIAATPATISSAATSDGPSDRAAAGQPLSPSDLVGMRAVGVTPEDVRAMRHAGPMTPDDVIAAKATGVDPTYIAAMRRLFPKAEIGELVGARAIGIDPAYARDMQRHFPGVTLDDLHALHAMGVTNDYIRQMRAAGYPLREPDDAVEARALGSWAGARVDGRRTATSKTGVTVDIGPGYVEARGNGGKVVRITAPEPPASPQPPQD